MNSTSADRFLGEYHLKELVSENAVSRSWLAEQASISRLVLVDELRPDRIEHKDSFLADVRAKAAVDHPLIGSVYEAVDEADHCFFAHELLHGESLEKFRQSGKMFPPAQLAHLLRQVAEAQLHHQAAGHATSPLDLDKLHLDGHGLMRIDNLAVAGARAPDQSARDIACLGEAMRPLPAAGQPGTTRMLTLLAWMRGEGLETALDWQQVAELCGQIEQQLAEPAPPPTTQAAAHKRQHHGARLAIALAGILALMAILALLIHMGPRKPEPVGRMDLPEFINIPSGRHLISDGSEQELGAFRIAPHEVTIGQYAEFLETLETLVKDGLERSFDHAEQPPGKTSHLPDDWVALLAAAKSGGHWNQRPVGLDSPVVGIDWWDAAAYAEWKKARLPSQEEWFAALRMNVEVPAAIPAADWLPVTSETSDRTPPGLLGMAGSVCEWTAGRALNPSNPLGERKWVITGGSFLKPGSNALTREWADDRSLRRPDLGFRIVRDAE